MNLWRLSWSKFRLKNQISFYEILEWIHFWYYLIQICSRPFSVCASVCVLVRPSHQSPFPSVWPVPIFLPRWPLHPPLPSARLAPSHPHLKPLPAANNSHSLCTSFLFPFSDSHPLCLSPSGIFWCSLHPSLLLLSHRTDAWLGSQQLSRHVPPPSVASTAGPGGAVRRVEGAKCSSHEYLCSLGCRTKQKMAPQNILHPYKELDGMLRKGGRTESGKTKDEGEVSENYRKCWQMEEDEGYQSKWEHIFKIIPPPRGVKRWHSKCAWEEVAAEIGGVDNPHSERQIGTFCT